MALDIQRIAAAVHYIIAKARPGKLGYVKLNKIMWYADLAYYRRHGVSISGLQHYTRSPQGPMSKEVSQQVLLLAKEGKAAEKNVRAAGYVRREMISLAQPDISALTAEQVIILDRVVAIISPLTANKLTQITQADPLWKELGNNDAMYVSTGSVISRPDILARLK